MDKNAIKKYAVWARRELISRVSQKAYQYGIRGNDIVDASADSIDGRILNNSEKKERRALIAQVTEKGFEQVMEEVAYTWFNRFVALRFMEANGYLPTHVRVFTDERNNFKPQIITEAIHIEMDGLDMDKVYALKEADDNDELFKYLLITQCNALNEILPGMFQKIADYTELLFPDNLLREGSIIEQMIALIPEDDWKDAVQIIGWLYQYYNSEPKDIVFANLKKNIKITKENIPAATQLFTPDWIVRYMVENSLGRLWLEGHPNDELKSKWDYYLDEAEQEVAVQEQLDKIREEYKTTKPEEIRLIDPCMGSGHILVYAFDVLMQIYDAYGFNQRDAVKSIVEKNIFGLDIDERAAQLAYFAVMMKARQYDRRFFSRETHPHVYAICESNHLDKFCVEYFVNGDDNLKMDMHTLIGELHDAKEYGSILDISSVDFEAMYARFDEIQDDINIMRETVLNELLPFVQVAHAMAQKYQIVITNPPYMSIANASAKVNDYVKKNYPDSKTDFFAVFIEKCAKMTHRLGYQVMITQQSFYFLFGLEALRKNIIMNDILINSVHLGLGAFGNDFGTVAFVFQKVMSCREYRGRYLYLGETKSVEEKEKLFLSQKCPQYYHSLYEFEKLPNCTYSYTVSSKTFEHFGKNCMSEQFMSGGRNKTHNDDKYLRLHWEVGNTSDKWIPYGKGGEFRKWYGNHYYVVNWSETARKFYASHGGLCNSKFWGHEGLTWSFVTSYKPSFRFKPKEMIYSSVSPTVFRKDFSRDFYMMGLLNSNVGLHFLRIISSTIGTNVGEVLNFPVVRNRVQEVTNLVEENLLLCKKDWDSFEVSPEFLRHPLLLGKTTLEAYSSWEEQCSERFEKLKKNERLLNEIFIDTYGLQGEVNAEVEERDVEASCRHAELHRDVKSFISYAVGCMFGRYSLDVDGPVYAGGQWDGGKYASFPVDADNIIPICDDEYFPDDIVGRFVKFIETVYGKDTLEENLKFIADVLGSKGMPRNVIRNYFLNNFYADHCKMYQKRPIYWLFDSGKKNGFKALIYMHRYQPDTLARMRTDYVHEQQERYRTAITHLEERISNSPTSERVKLNKQLGKLKDQATEIRVYEEEIHHLADQMIHIDLDDGVKKNYEIFKDVLAKIK